MTLLSRKEKPKKRSAGISLTPYLVIAGLVSFALTSYIGYRASFSDGNLFSISLIALFAGLLFESFRISNNWKTVVGIFVGTYFFSLLSFLPGKREQNYNVENHIAMWPYFFIFIFALFFGIVHKDKVTAKLTEGITLLLSISLVYWALDYGFVHYYNWFSVSLMLIGLLFSGFSILNALTHIKLSRANRLVLSIWSTVIMFAFAIDNIIRVFRNPDIENAMYLSDGLYIGIQYFLLGVSVVYIMQNYLLLAAFLPSKNGNYKRNLRENTKDHINRFSDEQVKIGHSLFCILFTGTVYWLNFEFQVLPRHTMIWLVFLIFPLILPLTSILKTQRSYQ